MRGIDFIARLVGRLQVRNIEEQQPSFQTVSWVFEQMTCSRDEVVCLLMRHGLNYQIRPEEAIADSLIFQARLQLSLRLVLDDVPILTAASSTRRAILWQLYVGVLSSSRRPENEWFISRLVGVCDELDLLCWGDTLVVLKNFLWPAAWECPGRLVWGKIVEARSERK